LTVTAGGPKKGFANNAIKYLHNNFTAVEGFSVYTLNKDKGNIVNKSHCALCPVLLRRA